MNNTCPNCGAAYPIKPEHVGRKTTCKSCQASLIVTEAGLEFRDANGSRPAPKLEPPVAAAQELPSNDYESESYDRPQRRSRRGGGSTQDYLSFRKMITPIVIQVLFWIIVGLILLGAGIYFIMALISGVVEAVLVALVGLVIVVPLYILFIRIYFEVLIVIFRMNDTLTDIHHELRKQRRD